MHAALEAGIVCFDTAPLYGDSEDRLGSQAEKQSTAALPVTRSIADGAES